jgi:hypothetical protein
MSKVNYADFPREKHYAVIKFDHGIGCDGDGWWNGDNAVNYFIKTYDELIEWVAGGPNGQYVVIEAYPMTVEVPKPILKSSKPYEMPPHLKEMRDKVIDEARAYAKVQRERIEAIQDPVMKAALIRDMQEEGGLL